MKDSHTGQCLCGGVRFEISGPLRAIIACHCSQCRRSSGHFVAATSAPTANIAFRANETLAWFRSSTEAERGFCSRCVISLNCNDASKWSANFCRSRTCWAHFARS